MRSFLEFSKSVVTDSHQAGTDSSCTTEAIDIIRREMQSRKAQCRRISPYLVRVTVGNEITDYQLPHQDGEVLWAVDYGRMTPTAKYFGRFNNGRFCGLKYSYSYFFENNQARQYVEFITEYRDGRPNGAQIYFDAQGEVMRRIRVGESAGKPGVQV